MRCHNPVHHSIFYFRVNHTTNSLDETNWTSLWPGMNLTMSHQLENETHKTQILFETHIHTCVCKPKKPQSDLLLCISSFSVYRTIN